MSRFVNPVPQYLDDAGNPLVDGKLYFYEVGSTTLKDTFLDAQLTQPNSNPVLLDAAGRVAKSGGSIYLSGAYRVVAVKGSPEVQVWERNNVGIDGGSISYGSLWNSTVLYNIPNVVLFDGIYYSSLQNNNINNQPDTSPLFWQELELYTGDNAGFSNLLINPFSSFFPAINQEAYSGGVLGSGEYGYDMWKDSGAGTAQITFSAGYYELTAGQIEQIVKDPGVTGKVLTLSADTGGTTVSGEVDGQSGDLPLTVTVAGSGNLSVKLSGGKIRNVLLAANDKATVFPARTQPIELRDCKSFFETSYIGVAPGTAASQGGRNLDTTSDTTAAIQFQTRYEVEKQSSTAVTVYSPTTGASGVVDREFGTEDVTVVIANGSVKSFDLQLSPAVINDRYTWHYVADARL